MAVAQVEDLAFSYSPASRPALQGVSLSIEAGERLLVLGPSGGGKTTLLRALAGLVPHFHGGRFSGRVHVGGRDTRRARPGELAGTVAVLFQDPEDQVVFSRVLAEVAFGLENLGCPPGRIEELALAALARVGAAHLAGRATGELSGGELQRVCLASTLALEPDLLLLDEPSSQLDPEGAAMLMEVLRRLSVERGTAVVIAEQRPSLPLALADRVLVLEQGALLLDAPREEALAWLAERRPQWLRLPAFPRRSPPAGAVVLDLEGVGFAYPGRRVLSGVTLRLRRGEIVALTGRNGSGKTTLAKLAAGLLEPQEGRVLRRGRAAYLCQDPGRYLVCERAEEEVALAVGGDRERARRALASVGLGDLADRHPRDLSSGERERLALASVLVLEPDVLVLDEPTRGLDPDRKAALACLLRRQAGERATLLVTHDLELAEAVADRVVCLPLAEERAAA